eukprot:5955851-Amphidinium_carterae.2
MVLCGFKISGQESHIEVKRFYSSLMGVTTTQWVEQAILHTTHRNSWTDGHSDQRTDITTTKIFKTISDNIFDITTSHSIVAVLGDSGAIPGNTVH